MNIFIDYHILVKQNYKSFSLLESFKTIEKSNVWFREIMSFYGHNLN